jgi:hypothetical protein
MDLCELSSKYHSISHRPIRIRPGTRLAEVVIVVPPPALNTSRIDDFSSSVSVDFPAPVPFYSSIATRLEQVNSVRPGPIFEAQAIDRSALNRRTTSAVGRAANVSRLPPSEKDEMDLLENRRAIESGGRRKDIDELNRLYGLNDDWTEPPHISPSADELNQLYALKDPRPKPR